MKGNKLLILSLLFSLVSCNKEDISDTKPIIEGVNAIECIVNSTVDLLEGVIAYDKEDGDITPNMEITITPNVNVSNGYAVFDTPGDYKISYTIKDSDENEIIKKTDITVIDREVYIDFANVSGFYTSVSGSAILVKGGMYNKQYLIEATNLEIFEDLSLNKVYSISSDYEYTFKYDLNLNASGKVRILVNDLLLEEVNVIEGDNLITFKYKPTKTQNVTISLLLGALGSEVKGIFNGVEYEYPQEPGLHELLTDFVVEGRLDKNGHDTNYPEPSINCSKEEGNIAKLEVINPYVTPQGKNENNIWRLGMFINTNIPMEVNKEYTVSFDVERKNTNQCEVVLQNKQWDEKKYHTFYVNNQELNNHYETTFIVLEENKGSLWLYVQSGESANEIKIKNLSVKSELTAIKIENISLDDFANFNDGFNCEFETFAGGFKYKVESFGDTDWMQKVVSPFFNVEGSGSNYIVSFKAKATKPIEVVFAAPIANGWDPTWIWNKFTISEDEKIYSFNGNDSNGDNGNQLVWQFGSTNNQKYNNVEIEISNVKISLKNSEYDGE